jgi:multidrug efflux system outer membrane protein
MYYQLRLEDREIEILEQTVHWRDNALKIAQGRFGAGLDNQLPVFQAQTELSSSQADLAAAKQRRASDQDALAVLCGVPTGEFTIAPAVMDFAPPKMEPGLPSELLERRPDVAAAERHLAAQNAKIGVAYAEFFPSISLTASGGYQSAALENIFDWRSTVWSFGPSISFPIFTGGRDKASLNSLKSAYEEAVAQYRQSILVAFQDVDDALAELKFLDEQAEARHMGLEASKAAAEMASTRYKNGAVNYLDVIDAERTRLDNELQMAQIDEQRMVATVQLIKAIGGGWDINPNPKKDVKQKGVVLQKLSETQ